MATSASSTALPTAAAQRAALAADRCHATAGELVPAHIGWEHTHTHTHSSECLVLEHPRWVGFLKDNDDAGKNEISIYTFIFILKGTNTIETHL